MLRRQRGVVEAQPRHHPGPEVLDEDVGRRRPAAGTRRAPSALLQVEHHAELAAVHRVEGARSRRRPRPPSRASSRRRGGSTLMTRAPMSASNIAQYGPAITWVTSRTTMPSSNVVWDIDGPIGTLTFARPEAKNAMTWDMYDAIVEACDLADASAVRVLIIRGSGGAFSSGTDIAQFADSTTGAEPASPTNGASAPSSIGSSASPSRPSRRSTARRWAAAARLPWRATCGCAPTRRGSACRWRAPSATACRWRTWPASSTSSAPAAPPT